MKGKTRSHVKGLASVDSERRVWNIHSDKSTDRSGLLHFLLGSVPTPASTPQRSPFLSSFHPPFPAFPFASLRDHKTPSCTLRMCISKPDAAPHTNSEPVLCFGRHCRSRHPPPTTTPSWKWFYSFNIISLNNDSVASWWGCREPNQMESRLTSDCSTDDEHCVSLNQWQSLIVSVKGQSTINFFFFYALL